MVGAPGSGKSFLASRLAQALGADLVQTDAVRRELFRTPRYTPRAMGAVYAVCHRRLNAELASGSRVIFDGTNLRERGRSMLYKLAERHGSAILVVVASAPEAIIRQRLEARETNRTPGDLSDADWAIYRRMAARAEPVRRGHVVVNTCVSPGPVYSLLRRLLDAVLEQHAAR
jgi:predicted kinase